jgi:hypothetical protein
MQRLWIVLVVLLGACGTVAIPAPSPTVAPTPTAPAVLLQAPLEACGTVRAWTAPTATEPGSITLGSRTHSVNAGTSHGSTGFTVKPGTDMCLFGGLDGQTAASVGATPIDSPFCGAVLAFTPASAAAAGSVTVLHFAAATLTVPAGIDLGTPPLGVRRCYTVATDTAGGAIVKERVRGSVLEMDLSLWCGTVKTYRSATATVPGALGIGSKSWLIGGGVAHESAYPKYRGDQTTMGEPTCLAGAIDDTGRLDRYLTSAMPDTEGGRVTSYLPATADRQGTLVFSYRYVRPIAPGVTLEAKPGTYVCVTQGLDPSGDRVVTGSIPCPGPRVN